MSEHQPTPAGAEHVAASGHGSPNSFLPRIAGAIGDAGLSLAERFGLHHERLRQEQRLIDNAEAADNTKPGTNFVPKRMRYEDMVDAWDRLGDEWQDYVRLIKRDYMHLITETQ